MATKTLYRADDAELYAGQWSCWTDDVEAAGAYTRNEGFAGPVVHAADHDINSDRVIDITGGDAAGLKQLAKLIAKDRETDYRDILDDLTSYGHDHVYHAWENISWVREWLESAGYDWVLYTDDFPVNCTTWCKLTD